MKKPDDRAKNYATVSSPVTEALICGSLKDEDSFKDTDAYDELKWFNSLANANEKNAMFDSSFTHVGIHCGCNKNSANVHMCCFQFGKDVTDKPTTKLINMIDIPWVNCEQSY